jgi:hypothetical protein
MPEKNTIHLLPFNGMIPTIEDAFIRGFLLGVKVQAEGEIDKKVK